MLAGLVKDVQSRKPALCRHFFPFHHPKKLWVNLEYEGHRSELSGRFMSEHSRMKIIKLMVGISLPGLLHHLRRLPWMVFEVEKHRH